MCWIHYPSPDKFDINLDQWDHVVHCLLPVRCACSLFPLAANVHKSQFLQTSLETVVCVVRCPLAFAHHNLLTSHFCFVMPHSLPDFSFARFLESISKSVTAPNCCLEMHDCVCLFCHFWPGVSINQLHVDMQKRNRTFFVRFPHTFRNIFLGWPPLGKPPVLT